MLNRILGCVLALLLVAVLGVDAQAKLPAPKMDSIGRVVSIGYQGSPCSGSCVLVSPRVVITCHHCIRSKVCTVSIAGKEIDAAVIAVDFDKDWAALYLKEAVDAKPLEATNDKPDNYEILKSYGFGSGEKWGLNVLRYVDGVMHGMCQRGDSGGPILDADGKIVSLNSCIYPSKEIMFGNHVGHFKDFVDGVVAEAKKIAVAQKVLESAEEK